MLTRKKSVKLALFTGLFAAVSVLSAAPASAFERGAYLQGSHNSYKLFNRLDVNDDGVLSVDEMTVHAATKAERVLKRKDKNEDGVVSFEEFQRKRSGVLADYSDIAEEVMACVADVKDETGNEYILVSDSGYLLSPQDRFARLDTSGDGFIDGDELVAARTARVTASFAKLDADEDGMLSRDEFLVIKKVRLATRRAVRQCIADIVADNETI
ncbi:EF-hand domain-containing protein [Thalassomonas viridans]|uniref:EF-hand domain-containing protein n=1 Tax=Thalassomonas viridans TaxID=137584 RepID=A0AAF0C8Q9_9GAMM|nr:EF-hand domain-containing protein [Thalassomonas viridans]WDE04440.1 EF-hand domain-containing protein [Thalassomonas viridans]